MKGEVEVQARATRVEEMLRHVCNEEEFPYLVSDEATLFDVCTLAPDEIVERLASRYGRKVQPKELGLPIWQLVDWLHAGES
jgi:hypothetical protein